MANIQITRKCSFCGQSRSITVDKASYEKYQAGAYIQSAFSNLSPAQREEIKTGIHPACWDAVFGSEED